MDEKQILYLVKHDAVLSQLRVHIVIESELTVLNPHEVYIILVRAREKLAKKRGRTDRQALTLWGHWCLCDTIQKRFIGFIDPLGVPCSSHMQKLISDYCYKYNSKFVLNKTVYQLGGTNICGLIICFVLLCRSRGISYKEIRTNKLNHSLKFITRVLPNYMAYFLPKNRKRIKRFSYDYFMA